MKSFAIIALLLTSSPFASAAPCVAGTLASYISLGATGCTLGGSTLGSFRILTGIGGSIAIPPQNVSLTPNSAGSPGITIQTNANAGANVTLETRFAYIITGATYTGIHIALSNAAANGDGTVTYIQDYCPGGTFSADGYGGCGPAGNLFALNGGSDQATFPGVTQVNVADDLTIDGGTSGSASGGTAADTFTASGGGTGGGTTGPIGVIDTPANNTSGVSGAIGVTGWALSSTGVRTVAISREANPGEPNQNGLVFLLNATLVPHSRPDVAQAYPGYPNNDYGWGAQILTNQLPSNNGNSGLGSGTYNLHAIVTDGAGLTKDLGVKTITVDNAHSLLPFGTIDTPAQGATVSGSYVNFGWALTPQPYLIPKDGSTITVYIDNQPVGHPVYNNYRVDVATAFPNYQNSPGPVGYYVLDTTKLANGLHTVSWVVTDNGAHSQGIGSRYFTVQN